MPLIERAAQALAKAQHDGDEFHRLTPDAQEQLRENVRTVIRALRVPTPVMCEAGHKLLEHERGHSVGNSDAHDAWQVMIDAAIGSMKPAGNG
ncbi:hypothetical protein EDF58_101748 [Novosphingobium sp. PhB57]|jgi:hypothetical protein|uniref:hypothetical protein n=1 Tax=unclassified Novosphingobium TaxID=2644732 RepID=UPI001049AF45|nr:MULTISPECIES: hypothetical protein [unclassified Novosphingobium]TCU61427.1 hypothetical protein EDF58_101748 [Novosphingobium sp. PhB57]TDW68495.1 hypothetical protein EDF57_101381 [Novosphingobium sp. PhB55]